MKITGLADKPGVTQYIFRNCWEAAKNQHFNNVQKKEPDSGCHVEGELGLTFPVMLSPV